MMFKSFEGFLHNKFGMEYVGLDDDYSDSFDDWLCDMDPDEWIALGDEYAETRGK